MAEEPMEVNTLKTKAVEDSALAKDLAEMKRQVNGLTLHFTKLMATLERGD